MKILRYNSKLQALLKCKAAPEPWLHIAIDHNNDFGGVRYVIYIWDTRKIIDAGLNYDVSYKDVTGTRANDNGKPLSGKAANSWNYWFGEDIGKVTTIKAALKVVKQNAAKYASMTEQQALDKLGLKPVKVNDYEPHYDTCKAINKTCTAVLKLTVALIELVPKSVRIDKFKHTQRTVDGHVVADYPNILVSWTRPFGYEREHVAFNWHNIFHGGYSTANGYKYDTGGGMDNDIVKFAVKLFGKNK